MKICKRCNKQNEDYNNFCTSCGTPLEEVTQPELNQPNSGQWYETPPMQNGFQQGHNQAPPIQSFDPIATLKQLVTSPLYLCMAILFSASLLINFISQSALAIQTVGFMAIAPIIGIIIGMIPMVLLLIGIWVFYRQSLDPYNRSTTALTLYQAYVIILLVLIGLLVLLSFFLLLVNAAFGFGGAKFAVVLMIVVVLALALPIAYLVLNLTVISSLKTTMRTGYFTVKGMGALAIFNYIFGALSLLGAVIPTNTEEINAILSQYTAVDSSLVAPISSNVLTLLSAVSMGVALILFGVILQKYKNSVKYHY